MSEKQPMSYKQLFPEIGGHGNETPEKMLGVEAVDHMLGPIIQNPDFMEYLTQHNLTVNDPDRLAGDASDPNFSRDLLNSVHEPEDLIVAILANHVPLDIIGRWVSDVESQVVETPGDSERVSQQKKLVRDALERNAELLASPYEVIGHEAADDPELAAVS